ncbi:sarcosine oxidase subunit gamma [Azospirillum sp. ST 5-10]|uniref:sarcosine oxidase subunit gamma n=1 Tax=unclassified Azospirillum TaxID=2630922 RepID=UPI003F49CEB1
MASALVRAGAVARIAAAHDEPPVLPAGTLSLVELTPPGQINLRGDPADPRFARAVGGVLDCVLPLTANTVQAVGDVTVLWLGPDEWLVLTAPGAESALIGRLCAALADLHAAVTDVTGNRALFRLSGPLARETLLKGCSLDLHPRSFRPGQCAQTLLARAGVILRQVDEAPTYDLLPRRSFGEYVWAWLADAMTEYGGRTA